VCADGVLVCERAREREGGRERVCVCVCVVCIHQGLLTTRTDVSPLLYDLLAFFILGDIHACHHSLCLFILFMHVRHHCDVSSFPVLHSFRP
jgi:hypothetical protein